MGKSNTQYKSQKQIFNELVEEKNAYKKMLNKLVQEWQVTGGNVMHTTMREAEKLLN